MRSCRSGKRQLQGALSKVHQLWQDKLASKKRRKLYHYPDLELILGNHPHPMATSSQPAQDELVELPASVSSTFPGVEAKSDRQM
jgi:hypothetical protein